MNIGIQLRFQNFISNTWQSEGSSQVETNKELMRNSETCRRNEKNNLGIRREVKINLALLKGY